MRSGVTRAVGALLRLREFTESQAGVALAQRMQALARAEADAQAGLDSVKAVQKQREDLQAGLLDPAVMQLAAAIEDQAWVELQAHREKEAEAKEEKDGAHQALLEARARTRVAEARHARLRHIERDHREKVAFDQLADLHQHNRKHRHD